jgi:hypothetical protein
VARTADKTTAGAGVNIPEAAVARVASVASLRSDWHDGGPMSLEVRRNGGPWATIGENDLLLPGDEIQTDGDTAVALEWLTGGRVGVNRSTKILIVGDRNIADGDMGLKRQILKSAALWVKTDAASLKQPLEIQTNGGVMGIKG